jgi:hypothetical protein
MTYLDPYKSSPEQIDHVRLTGFQRAGTRPSSKLRRPPSETHARRLALSESKLAFFSGWLRSLIAGP